MTEAVTNLVETYFADLHADSRPDNGKNLDAWLWFQCPADLREEVREGISHAGTS